MYIRNGKRININAAFTDEKGTQYPAGALRDPAVRYALNVTEIPDPFREDPDFFYVQEIDVMPYVVNAPKPLDQIKKMLRDKVNAMREAYEVGGFVFEGNVYQSDQRSYDRMQAMATATLVARSLGRTQVNIYWTTADNKAVAMSEQKVLEFFLAFTDHGANLFQAATRLKTSIERATTIDELRALDLDNGWQSVGTIPK